VIIQFEIKTIVPSNKIPPVLSRLARDLRLPAGITQPPTKPDVRENAAPSYKSVSQKDDDEGGSVSGGGLC